MCFPISAATTRAAGNIRGHAFCMSGVPGQTWLRLRSLATKSPRADPLLPQTENGVLLPSLQSALPFLDLHGTPRLEFHQSVFDELRDKLLERVSAIASEGKAEER